MENRTRQLLDSIKTMRFLGAVGIQPEGEVSSVASWKQAMEANRSKAWDWVLMEAQNVLTRKLCRDHPDRYRSHWNEMVEEIKPEIEAVVQKLGDSAPAKGRDRTLVEATLAWTLLAICMEKEFEDLFTTPFYQEIWNWYQRGHFPCGWDGVVDPEGDFERTMATGRLMVF